jgi:hypothetical protein
MTVSATNSNVPNLAVLLQQYGAKVATATTSVLPIASDADGDKDQQGIAGLGMPQPFGGMRGRFESAISDALSQAPEGSDPNQVIQDTLAELMSSEVGGTKPDKHKHDKDPDQVDATADAQKSKFLKMLAAHGVDAQQFQKDLQLALAKAQNGVVDLSGPFGNFPPGAEIDAVA